MQFEAFIVKVKRAESPFYAGLKRFARWAMRFRLPFPRAFDPVYLSIHYSRRMIYEAFERLCVALYRFPLLRAQCASVGERLQMERVPAIEGPIRVYLGNDVRLSGRMSFSGARILPDPELRIGDRTFIGHGCSFSAAKSIFIGDDVLIAGGCSIFDYSGHPLNPELRAASVQVDPEDVRPVRIENKAWLGKNAIVLPGVVIGEGAVIGAATVVTKDVPPGHICVGNPGRVLSRTVGKSEQREESRLASGNPDNQ
jgi:acetyltransferase-like isoleucine patch superfamily enzyme